VFATSNSRVAAPFTSLSSFEGITLGIVKK
jgi:hypothetical protein